MQVDSSNPDHDVVRNVKRCQYCQGAVNRLIVKGTAGRTIDHANGETIMFQCSGCDSVGDKFMGMMNPPSQI